MKPLLLIFSVLLFTIPFLSAYEIGIDSVTDSRMILSFSGLDSFDVKFTEVTATAETPSTSDAFIVDTTLSSTSDKILLSIDISPLGEDYSNINSVLISGYIESNGEKEKFSKRVSLRPEASAIKSLAPEISNSTLIYWTTGLAVLFVILVIVFLFVKRPQKVIPKRVKKKSKKRVKKKVRKKRL